MRTCNASALPSLQLLNQLDAPEVILLLLRQLLMGASGTRMLHEQAASWAVPQQATAWRLLHLLSCILPPLFAEQTLMTQICAGAETGAGGRIRDTHATGIGSLMGCATAGYCVGALRMEGHRLGGEEAASSWVYPASLAPPLQVGGCMSARFRSEPIAGGR